MLNLLALATDTATDLDYSSTMPPVDPGVAGGLIVGMLLFYLVLLIGAAFISVFTWGNILQAALGKSKWTILLTFIPVANVVFIILWSIEASKINKGRSMGNPNAEQNFPPQAPQGPIPPTA